MKKVGLLFDDRYLLHDPGSRHPESPRRLRAVQRALENFPTIDRWARIEPRPARPSELELIHHPRHLERVEEASNRAPAYLDAETPPTPAARGGSSLSWRAGTARRACSPARAR